KCEVSSRCRARACGGKGRSPPAPLPAQGPCGGAEVSEKHTGAARHTIGNAPGTSLWTMRLLPVYALLTALAAPALRGQNVNLARQGVASQSSTACWGDASRAIDGVRDGFWPHNSVTMTQDAPGSWWQVAFPVDVVNEVNLYNRSDACWLRLANFRVEVSLTGSVLFSQDFFTNGGSVGPADSFHPVPPPRRAPP